MKHKQKAEMKELRKFEVNTYYGNDDDGFKQKQLFCNNQIKTAKYNM